MTVASVQLPVHIAPMLARIGAPFDSPQHVFELKWDGVRAISYVDDDGLRMHGRRRRDLASRYPELGFLRELPAGTVLDGELVVLAADGRPDFPGILRRENTTAARAAAAAASAPVVYIAFDLLYQHGQSCLAQPFAERREALAQTVAQLGHTRLVAAEGIVGRGLELFAMAAEQGLEGIVAKRLDATYRPGERGDAWVKMKPTRTIHCLVLGYEPDGERDFKSLIVATDFDGELRCVGKVGTGFTAASKTELWQQLRARPASQPLVANDESGVWVEPGLYCTVRYLERTANGNLRAPVFVALQAEAR